MSLAEATTLINTYKEQYAWSLFTTFAHGNIHTRVVSLRHNDSNGFHIPTRKGTSKIAQITANPLCTLSFYPGTGYSNVVITCEATLHEDAKSKKDAYYPLLDTLGYKGDTDPELLACKFKILKVVFGEKTISVAPVAAKATAPAKKATGAALKTEAATKVITENFASNATAHLLTVDAPCVSDRMMVTNATPTLGLFTITHDGTAKTKQIAACSTVLIVKELKESYGQIDIEATCKLDRTPETKKAVWNDALKGQGYTGPEDPKLVVIRFNPTKVIVHCMGKPAEELPMECKICKDMC